jgi:hypothetical protein
VLLFLLVAITVILQGCSYLRYRYEDAAEIMDLGFSFTKTPQFAAYSNCPITRPMGYGKLDGVVVGIGGGGAGIKRHQLDSAGLLFWGREESGWQSFSKQRTETLSVPNTGLMAMAQPPEESGPRKPTCSHYLHLGWVGIVWNMRWLDVPDFLAGLFCMDPLRDDGPNGGWWFGRKPPPETTAEGTLKTDGPDGELNIRETGRITREDGTPI